MQLTVVRVQASASITASYFAHQDIYYKSRSPVELPEVASGFRLRRLGDAIGDLASPMIIVHPIYEPEMRDNLICISHPVISGMQSLLFWHGMPVLYKQVNEFCLLSYFLLSYLPLLCPSSGIMFTFRRFGYMITQ